MMRMLLNCNIGRYGFLLLFLLCLKPVPVSAQSDIESSKEELNLLRIQIDRIQEEIGNADQKEKATYELIEKYNEQNFLVNKLINSLRDQEKQKDRQITKTENDIRLLEEENKQLKGQYAAHIVAAYKGIYDVEWFKVFDAESVKQAILRYKYLKEFSDKGKEALEQIKLTKEQLLATKDKLVKEKAEKQRLRNEKKNEEQRLKSQINDKKMLLSDIRSNQEALGLELQSKKKNEQKIESLISDLIRREEEKRLAEERQREEERLLTDETVPEEETSDLKDAEETLPETPKSTDEVTIVSSLKAKGKISWPVTNGKVIREFGQNKNEQLNTVTMNNGIDIQVPSSSPVTCIGEGIVSLIEWLPGYGSVVIIKHKNRYRSVYGHLAEIFVTEGDKINAGETVGSVGESLEGYILHFELWHERTHLNPLEWLTRK